MIDTILILLLSLAILGKSAQVVIDNSITLARFFRISELAVGFILLSVATSLPELAVSIVASLEKQGGIVIGNILGSNIANIGIVLGVSVFLSTISFTKRESSDLIKILSLTLIIPFIVFFYIGSFIGIVLLLIFIIYAYFILRQKIDLDGSERIKPKKAVISAFMFMIGVLLVIGSSKYVVDSAVQVAGLFGVSNAFIAATLIALGTSLPEFAVNLSAVKNKHPSLAIGNVIGSCVTNLTLIMGISALINPLNANFFALLNLIIFLTIMNISVLYFLNYRKSLGRNEGFVLIGIYLIFLASSILVEIRT